MSRGRLKLDSVCNPSPRSKCYLSCRIIPPRLNSGAWCWARIRSVRFGERREIHPPPPPSGRSGTRPTDRYIWFELGEIVELATPLRSAGRPPVFGLTNRLALESQPSDIFDLLLVREPERRLVQELRAAGMAVRVYDDTNPGSSPFDVASLRLRLAVSGDEGRQAIDVRFNPRTTRFSWERGGASWNDLMFAPDHVVREIQKSIADISGKTTRSPSANS